MQWCHCFHARQQLDAVLRYSTKLFDNNISWNDSRHIVTSHISNNEWNLCICHKYTMDTESIQKLLKCSLFLKVKPHVKIQKKNQFSLFSLAGPTAVGPGWPRLLPYENYRDHCALRNNKCSRMFFVALSRSVSCYNFVSEFLGQFFWSHWYIFCSNMHYEHFIGFQYNAWIRDQIGVKPVRRTFKQVVVD